MKRNVFITIISVLILVCIFAYARTTTTDLGLIKPVWTENVDILYDINANSDVIEAFANDPLEFDTGERLEDRVGAMWTGNTETFITLTYQDGDNTIDAVVPVLDEDNMASDSATYLATQQSIKAYVDTLHALQYLKTQIDTLPECETIWGLDVTTSTELATALTSYYLKTAIDTETEMETIWGVGLAHSGANSDITSMTGFTTALGAAYGGTGVINNAGETITMVGDDPITFTTSDTTSVTLPTTGTLATTAQVIGLQGVSAIGAVTFVDATHILSVATITYWFGGVSYTTASPVTCDIDSYETLTANTLYYFYFDDSTGTLKCSDTAWNFYTQVSVATIFWNGTNGAIQKEWHNSTRNIAWHEWSHNTVGTRYEAGLSLTAPTTIADATLTIESGSVQDEDLLLTIGQQTTCRIVYKASASIYTWVNSSLPYAGDSADPKWLDTDNYTLTSVGDTDFVCMWVYATDDTDRPVYIIPTHASNAHNTINLARAEIAPVLSSLNLNPEMKLIYRFIYKGDGQFQESNDYRLTSPLPSGGSASTNASAVAFSPTGNIIATTVQTALEEVDTEKAKIGANSDITSMTGLTTALAANYGGTGIANNAAETITIGGAGTYALTLTLTNTTNVTLPTSGTVLTNAANTIDSDQYVDASIDHEHLAPDAIHGWAATVSTDSDEMIIWDYTDSALKKVSMAEVRGAGGGASQLSDLTDVGVTTPTNKYVLVADGDSWESRSLVEADISDLGTAAALVADKLSAFAATTSAELAGVISDETGTNKLVYSDSPSLASPTITGELGGELDAGAHSIGFTQQIATGDGTTTINWTLGNKFYFTFGAFNETFTFTHPTNPCNIVLVMKQDATGSRTATWDADVFFPGGTHPTLTTGANLIDIICFYYDGTNFFGMAGLDFK
jgi:hypothetical protein